MRQRRETVEHPFGTMKARMGATHFLTRTLSTFSACSGVNGSSPRAGNAALSDVLLMHIRFIPACAENTAGGIVRPSAFARLVTFETLGRFWDKPDIQVSHHIASASFASLIHSAQSRSHSSF
jgi:hypothetical protein